MIGLACLLGLSLSVFEARAQDLSASINSGAIKLGPYNASCTSGLEGVVRYDSTAGNLDFCDGTAWQSLWNSSSWPSAPAPAANGYFVITNDTFDGNLGGLSGAHDKCLSDLQTYDWMGKASATLDDGHVFAFLCYSGWNCTYAADDTEYHFAVSGDNTLGGDTFTTNSSNEGPGFTSAWNTAGRFGTTGKQFWSGYRTGDNTWWTHGNGTAGNNDRRCGGGGAQGWDTNSSAQTGTYGLTSNTGAGRYRAGETGCNNALHLVCMVNP